MAWIKCNSIEYIPPIPTQTFSTGVSDQAGPKPGGGTHHIGDDIPKDYPISVVINTKKVRSFTIHVKYKQGAYASDNIPDWNSYAEITIKYTFRVNNITAEGKSLNDYRNQVSSDDNGWVREDKEWDFTFTDDDLPDGECTIYANTHVEGMYQNGDQWDPSVYSYLYFTITNVQYK